MINESVLCDLPDLSPQRLRFTWITDKHWFISRWIPFLGIAMRFLKHDWSDYCMSMNGWQCLAVLENNFVSCDQFFLFIFFLLKSAVSHIYAGFVREY